MECKILMNTVNINYIILSPSFPLVAMPVRFAVKDCGCIVAMITLDDAKPRVEINVRHTS